MNLQDALGGDQQSNNPTWPGGQGGGSWPSNQGGGSWPSNQGGGSWPASQGGGSWPASQGGGSWPASQGGGPGPASQGGGSWPASQGGGPGPASQGGGSWPASQGGGSWPGSNPSQPSQPTQPSAPGGWPSPSSGPTAPHNLTVPYNQSLPNGVFNKLLITIAGKIKPNANMVTLDLCAAHDVAFHFNCRFNDEGRKVVVRNSCVSKKWGKEERELGRFPFVQGGDFEIKIMCTNSEFKVAVNGAHLLEFKHRVTNLSSINRLNIHNDLTLSKVHMETLH